MKKITADMVKFDVSTTKANPMVVAMSMVSVMGLDPRWVNHVTKVRQADMENVWMTGTVTVTASFAGLKESLTMRNLGCNSALEFDNRVLEPIIVPELLGKLNESAEQLSRLLGNDEDKGIDISFDSMIEALARDAEDWDIENLVGFAVHELRTKFRAMRDEDPSQLVEAFEFQFGDEEAEELERISKLTPFTE